MDNENYCAKIKCCFCDFISTGYSTRNSSFGRRWTLSNFNKHILTHIKNINKKYKKSNKPNNTLLSFIQVQKSNNNSVSNSSPRSLPSEISLQSEDENPNYFLHIPEITPDTLTDAIQNAEIYISPSLNTGELNDLSSTNSSNLQPLCPIQNNESYCDKTSNLLDISDFDKRRIIEKADNSAILNNKPQTQIKKKAKIDIVSGQQRKLKYVSSFETFEESQTKITDYFLKTITEVIEDHSDIKNTLLNITNVENTNEKISNINVFLDCLRDTAIKNIKRKKHGNTFSEPLKLFSLYIFIVGGGRMLYELLYANLQNILPSITTINRCIDKESNIVDGTVQLKELKLFLIKRNYLYLLND